MKKVKKNEQIHEINQYGAPIITIHDVLAGMIVMAIIIFTIILCMQWSEGDRKWIQKDSNVMEETIQHYNPNLP